MPQQLFDEWLEVIAERTGTDPDRDMYPRLVVAVVRAVGDAAVEAHIRGGPAGGDHRANPRGLRRRQRGPARTCEAAP